VKRHLIVLGLLASCAHRPVHPAPTVPAPEATQQQEKEPPQACTAVAPELTLRPLPPEEMPTVRADDFVTLRREGCFGTCPAVRET
jgi:hypothetical protein